MTRNETYQEKLTRNGIEVPKDEELDKYIAESYKGIKEILRMNDYRLAIYYDHYEVVKMPQAECVLKMFDDEDLQDFKDFMVSL